MADIQRLFDLADPRIRAIWDEKQTQLSTRLDYGDIGLTDHNAEILDSKFENFTGLGIAQATGEKEPYNREDINAGYNVTITPKKFTKAIEITEEMLRFNLWPKINNLVGGVANALNARINTDAAKVLYLGFGTTFLTGGDSKALFATDHPINGTTQSNSGGTNPLSYDNLKTAIQAMDRYVDDKGIQLLPCQKLRLIVARENKERAIEVLKSIGNPDSANRLSNVFQTENGLIDLKVAYWIPSGYSKYWFVMDMERANLMAKILWGWKPRFDDDKVINNGTKIYTGSVMFAPGFQSWQWCYGSAATA